LPNICLMMMRPHTVRRRQVRFDRVFLSGCMTHDFAAFADTLIWLDMGTCGYFLQKYLDRFCAFLALESERA
jgi:hypothetical protein